MSRFKYMHKVFVFLMMYMISGVSPALVFALPEGGQITAGQGSIHQHTPQDLHIHQDTGNLIINWQGFNIGGSESVQFQQPGIDSVALNRVTGIDPSIISGILSANGQVFITNPSGVIFTPGAQVNVHGLLATTLGISDQDFLNKNYNFFQDPARGLAPVLNEGVINASYVGLLAPSVVNRGTIVANLGSVALASGKAATLDFIGDDLINFAITEEVTGTATDADGNILDHNINNEGLIRADGGQVSLSVRRAGEIIKSVINQEGVIEARTVVDRGGRIFLSGGDSGIVSVAGTLDASGEDSGEKGGWIHVTGENVGLFETAKLDASGDAGGGEILIGGDRQGQGDLPNARATFVGENVSVNADAINEGDGGKIIVYADDSAKIYGSLSARGGSVSGNGGFIETSGKQYFEILKTPDIGAPNGLGGEWLIDPFDITVTLAAILAGINGANPFESFANSSTLPVGLILTALGLGNVTITTGAGGAQAGNITWDANAPLNFAGPGNNSLSVDAAGTIFFNADITTQGALFATAPSIRLDNATINSNNNPIVVTTNNLFSLDDFLTSFIDSGTASTTLLPFSGGLDIGTGPGILSSNVDLLTFLTASSLILGNGLTGPVTVDDADAVGIPVFINSGSSVTFTGLPSLFGDLTVNAGNLIIISAALDVVGQLTMQSTNGIGSNENVTSQGTMSFNAGTGAFSFEGNIDSNGNAIDITADVFFLPGSINSGVASTTIVPFTAGTTIGLGAGAGILSLTNLDLGSILAANLNIGDNNTGAITVNGVSIGNDVLTLTSGNTVTFTGATSTFETVDLFAPDITVNTDVEVLVGSFFASGSGTFSVGPAATVTTNNNFIDIFMNDIDLQGFLDSGAGTTIYVPQLVSSIGVGDATICDGTACDVIFDRTELSHVSAGNLEIGFFDANITVENVTSPDVAGISGTVFFDATSPGGTVDFTGSPSFFPSVNVLANSDVNVNTSVTTTNSDFVATSNNGDFNLAGGTSVTASNDITITAVNINQNGTFNAGGALNLNGVLVNQPPPNQTPTTVTTQTQQQQQGTDAAQNFIDEFAKNSQGTGC